MAMNMNMNHRALMVFGAMLSSGLVGLPAASADEVTAGASVTQSCRYVGTVQGTSGFGKHPDWVEAAKQDALHKSKGFQAPKLVWTKVHPTGSFNGQVTALAYQCS